MLKVIGVKSVHITNDSQIKESIFYGTANTKKSYKKLPEIFNGEDSWPTTSELKCWYCSNNFSSFPKFIPTVWAYKNEKLNCSVYGNFCTWECAKSFCVYMNMNISNAERSAMLNNLTKLAKIFGHKTPIEIKRPYYDYSDYLGNC